MSKITIQIEKKKIYDILAHYYKLKLGITEESFEEDFEIEIYDEGLLVTEEFRGI